MKESILQRRMLQFLRQKNIFCYKNIITSEDGIPDIICCVNGKAIFIECKNEKGKQSPLQLLQQKRIQDSKGLYILLTPNKLNKIKQQILSIKNIRKD